MSVRYNSYKSKRVARSQLSAEVIPFSELYDYKRAIHKQVDLVLRQRILKHIFMVSKRYFNIRSNGCRTIQNTIMFDIYAA